jgi:5-exo-hydroxycamphor dehydrogenase
MSDNGPSKTAGTWKGKVAVFNRPGVPVELREEENPDPAANEVIVRMLMAGVCGTDAHRLSGDVPIQSYPVCFGHEAVGRIEAVGSDVKADSMGRPITVGDRVYWNPSTPCGTCDACEMGSQMLCKDLKWPARAGGPNGAAFREFATLNERNIKIKIPEGTSSESVITFGCAMPTALRGFSRLSDVGPKSEVVIQGSGPVGLASTLLASLAGAKNIIVIGDPESRLDIASKLGATEVMSISKTTAQERKSRVLELTNARGANIVVEAAGAPKAFPEGFELLGMNGQFLIMGLYSGKAVAPIDPVRINNLNLKIIGTLGIGPEYYFKTVEIATKHGKSLKFESMITHRLALGDLEEAIGTVARGESIKTIVVP